MILIIYLTSIALTFFLSITIAQGFNLDTSLVGILVIEYPINMAVYVLCYIIFLFFGNNKQKFQRIFVALPTTICFVFWFAGTIVYNFIHSKVDFKDFMVLAFPHMVMLCGLVAWQKYFSRK